MSSTQHRCVFVGNIPYDATEEELVRICEEVGPVVSFRLVIDRETGKPKGYGFCEYRDEETALSARRNLQGYEINGRQLRVDFAENEKGSADRSRDQLKGRGGPGFVDLSKQSAGLKGIRDASLHQPVGLNAAVTAATVMASLLGGPQFSVTSMTQLGVGRTTPGIDGMTIHLAGMSKYQLYDVLNQMKNFIQHNQQQAQQILASNPQFVKALLQAQIILGWVPQVPFQSLQTQGVQQGSMMQAQQVQGTAQVQQHGIQPVQAQRAQNFPFPMPAPTQPQTSGRTGPMLIPQQPLPPPPSSLGLPPLNFTMQQRSQPQPPLHLNPPPLPQQLRPMLPPSPPRVAQVTGVQLPLSQLPSVPQMQQLSGVPANLLFMGIPPPLPNQPPPQVLQAPRPMGEVGGNGNISMQGGLPTTGGLLPPTSGVISQFGSGIVSEVPPTSSSYTSWNQLAASSEPITVVPSGVPLGTITPQSIGMSMGPSHTMLATSYQQAVVRPASYEGSAVLQSQEYSQPLMQAPPIQQLPTQQVQSQQLPSPQLQSQQLPAQQLQSQQLPSQPQMAGQQPSQQQPQISLEPEQQKALLQQVMNLTPEQINSLPPEQRQQVLDLQQAFHNHII